jgi:hypothetical protein
MSTHTAETKVRSWRRIGQFAVGAFAAFSAAIVPRLAVQFAPQATPSEVTLEAFTSAYLTAAAALALIVGGVVLILEWNGTSSPRDTFLSALAIPALLTGAFNTAAASSEAKRLAEENYRVNQARAEEAGIETEEPSSPRGESSLALPSPFPAIVPTAFADDGARSHPAPALQLGIRTREPRYWISLGELSAEAPARSQVEELERKYGSLKDNLSVEKRGANFYVVFGRRSLPYSEAISTAIELKRKSGNVLTPKLVRIP